MSYHGSAKALNGEYIGLFWFISILLILCVLLLFWITDLKKTFKMPTKIDDDATYAVMGLNNNGQEPLSIDKNADVTDDQ